MIAPGKCFPDVSARNSTGDALSCVFVTWNSLNFTFPAPAPLPLPCEVEKPVERIWKVSFCLPDPRATCPTGASLVFTGGLTVTIRLSTTPFWPRGPIGPLKFQSSGSS